MKQQLWCDVMCEQLTFLALVLMLAMLFVMMLACLLIIA